MEGFTNKKVTWVKSVDPHTRKVGMGSCKIMCKVYILSVRGKMVEDGYCFHIYLGKADLQTEREIFHLLILFPCSHYCARP